MKEKSVEIYETDTYLCIKPLLSITDDILDDFKSVISKWCEHTQKHIVLDFQHVYLLSSIAITNLIRLYKLQQNKKKEIALVCLTKETANLFDSINLSKIIPIFDSVDEFIVSLDSTHQPNSHETVTKVRVENQNNISIVHFENTKTAIGSFRVDFDSIFSQIDNPNVIVNLKNSLNMDENSISSFISYADNVKSQQGKFVLVGVNDTTKDLFNILTIEAEFLFADDIDEGIKMICS